MLSGKCWNKIIIQIFWMWYDSTVETKPITNAVELLKFLSLNRDYIVLYVSHCHSWKVKKFSQQVSAGDSGWDVFSLCYKVDGPIGTVM